MDNYLSKILNECANEAIDICTNYGGYYMPKGIRNKGRMKLRLVSVFYTGQIFAMINNHLISMSDYVDGHNMIGELTDSGNLYYDLNCDTSDITYLVRIGVTK